jgi:hypothetical protein
VIVPPVILKKATLRGLPAMKKRDLNACLKRAYTAVGKWWLRTCLKQHFRPGAASRYGYPKRGAKYLRKKKALRKHTQPLKYRGTLERQVTSPGRQRLIVTKKGVRIKLRHDARHRKVHQDLVRLALDGGELEQANEVLARAFQEALEDYEHKARKTVRAG